VPRDTVGTVGASSKCRHREHGGADTDGTRVSAASASASQINLIWSAATEALSEGRLQHVRAQVGCASGTTFSDAALAAATSYSYRMRATDAAGDLGPCSNAASASTGSASQPSITFVQAKTLRDAADPCGGAYAAAQGAGDLNLVVVGWNDSTALVGTVTDSAGNTYQPAAGLRVISGTASKAICYAANMVPSATTRSP
jgi:hypothetical protein